MAEPPKWFYTKRGALAWQRKIVTERLDGNLQGRLDRFGVPEGYRQAITRFGEGWRNLVPIVWFDELQGEPYSGDGLREFLPLDDVSPEQGSDFKGEVDELLDEGISVGVTCDLGKDWKVNEILKGAKTGKGHTHRGRTIKSLYHRLVMVAYDVDDRLPPSWSVQQRSAFWVSWPVWQHIDREARKILQEIEAQDPDTAAMLHGAGVNIAVEFVCRKMWEHAQRITSGNAGPTASKISPSTAAIDITSAGLAIGERLPQDPTMLASSSRFDQTPKTPTLYAAKRGRPSRAKRNQTIAELVLTFGSSWKEKGYEICELIDTLVKAGETDPELADCSIPKEWRKWQNPPKSWVDAFVDRPPAVMEALEYAAKHAQADTSRRK
jgi:hypothetical protein